MSNITMALAPGAQPIAKVKVAGVGGAGGNAVRRMMDGGLSRVEFIAINTDEQVLSRSGATTQMCVGRKITDGLGAGGDPKVGRAAVEENKEDVKNALAGADMVFVTAGMGGGTGTGAAPVVATVAREQKALTVGVVTMPFGFEGTKRTRRAEEGLRALREQVDTLIIVSNDRMIEKLPGDTPILKAFEEADNVLRHAVQGITDIILVPGVVNLDFADVRSVMSHRGNATMGVGRGEGGERAAEAAAQAIASPLLEDVSIAGAKGLLVNITGGPGLTQRDAAGAMTEINNAAGEDADVFFGIVIDEKMSEDELLVTLIATGFEGGLDADLLEEHREELMQQELAIGAQDAAAMESPTTPEVDLTRPTYDRDAETKQAAARASAEDGTAGDGRGGASPDVRVPTFLRRSQRKMQS